MQEKERKRRSSREVRHESVSVQFQDVRVDLAIEGTEAVVAIAADSRPGIHAVRNEINPHATTPDDQQGAEVIVVILERRKDTRRRESREEN